MVWPARALPTSLHGTMVRAVRSPLTMIALLLLIGEWVVAAETDVNPPVISLDLTQQIRPVVESTHASLPCQQAPNSGYCRSRFGTNEEGNTFQEQYARVCQVFDTAAKCATPTATALDHHEGELHVVERVKLFLESAPGDPRPPQRVNRPVAAVDRNMRGEFLITYDAEDSSGNKAEQLVFAMIGRLSACQ